MFRDLRDFLEVLEKDGELLRVKEETDPRYEVGAIIRKLNDQMGPAVFFERLKGYSMPMVGNVCGTRRRIALGLNATERDVVKEYLKRTREPIPPVLVGDGPVHEVVKEGRQVDLTQFPNPTLNEYDAGPYITPGVLIAKHPDTGIRNAGIYRLMVRDRDSAGIEIDPPQHLALYLLRAEELGRPLEIAVALGAEPALSVAAAAPVPFDQDELAIAGALKGRPVELVKCRTVDLEVPANAEIVLEGEMLPGVREPEGPFGEFPGYYCGERLYPVIRFKAITHRRDPIYHTAYTGYPVTENHTLNEVGATAKLYKALVDVVPEVRDVYLTPGGCSLLTAIVSIHKNYEESGKRAIYAALGAYYVLKTVIVVEEDIDIYNHHQVEWAVATRVQPERDVIIIPCDRGMPLDPSQDDPRGQGITSKIGIDATRPLKPPFAKVARPPKEVMERIEERWEETTRGQQLRVGRDRSLLGI